MVKHAPPQTCVELLQQMVSFNTVNRIAEGIPFVEGELANYLDELATGWGFQTQRLEISDIGFNLLVTQEVDPQAPWLLFDSHMDTVSVDGMTVDPFGGEIVNGKLYGRGACDTKGTGTTMLWALKTLADENSLDVNIAILYTIDEEITRTGVKTFLREQLETLDWRPAAVVVGEPTCLRAVTAHNGTVRWQISTSGRAAHSSDPSQGHSAISDMTRVIDAIEKQYIPRLTASHELVGKAQCSINLISGGTLINMIPERCTVTIDRRTVPGEDATQVLPTVESVLDLLRQESPGLNVAQHDAQIQLSLSPDKNQEFSGRVAKVLRSLDLDDQPIGAKYGTHASDFAGAGFPAVVLGPGDIAQAHCKDEHITLEQLEKGVEVYRHIMRMGF